MNGLFLFQGLGMIAVGLLAVIYWKRRSRVSTVFFLWGGFSWIVAIALKSVAALPFPQIITRLRDLTPEYISEPLLWLFIGLLTGIFECGVCLVIIYRVRRLRLASWGEALGYGLGFGAMESTILGVYSFVIVLFTITMPDQLPPELLALISTRNASVLAIPAPIIERAATILLHAFSVILIVYAVQRREWKWFWISLLYKTAIDTIAGFFQITYGVQNLTLGGVWLVELVVILFGLIGLWGLITFRDRWPPTGWLPERPAAQGNLALDPTGPYDLPMNARGD